MIFQTKTRGPRLARLGTLTTSRGTVQTPNFVFCGTRAAVKCIRSDELMAMGAEIILSNTYHLLLNPGSSLIRRQGGIPAFMNWSKPMMTDSGGYQIFAMGHGSVSKEIKRMGNTHGSTKSVLSIEEEGAQFKSYIDGKKILLSPEASVACQLDLGADLIVQLDECTPYHIDKSYTHQALKRSLRWGQRSIDYYTRHVGDQDIAMLGVIQGGIHKDLRKESIETILNQQFFGLCVGGSLGGERSQMHDIVAYSMDTLHACTHLPTASRNADLYAGATDSIEVSKNSDNHSHPYTHLLGIGEIEDIFWGVEYGIDCFDCVSPTRIARHGTALTKTEGKINIFKTQYKEDSRPLEPQCPYWCCKTLSRAYLRHLFKSREMLGMMALTTHNCGVMIRLMSEIRNALASPMPESEFRNVKRAWLGGV